MKNPENPAKINAAVEGLANQLPGCRVLVLVEEPDADEPDSVHIHIQATMGKRAVTAILLHVLKAQGLADVQIVQQARDAAPDGN